MHAHCTRCRDKLKGTDPSVSKEDFPYCSILIPEQKLQLSMPSYQKNKEKHEKKSVMTDKSTRSDKSDNIGDTLVVCSLFFV